jgi:glucose/mannose transport system substrate-binding protein
LQDFERIKKGEENMSKKIWYSLMAIFVIATMVLSACGPAATELPAPATEPPAPAATEPPVATEPPAPAEKTEVEVFSWWTGGGEAAGLEAMIVVFNAKYPDITFINGAVAGGAGTNARAVLATRLQAGDPPDSFQAHAGQEIIGTYVNANQIEPLDDFFASSGFADVLPPTLLPLISKDGHPYSVPVNIHRSNVMWYNPSVLTAAGVDVPATWDEFFAACDTLVAAGKICLSMGPAWTALHLFENVLLGSLGVDAYNGLWTGTTDWASPEVTAALDNYAKALSYTNSDAATLADWQPASKLVADGDAAFNIMGDWADGYFAGDPAGNNLGLTPGTEYAWAPVPGTDGVFNFLSDSFVLPVGAKHPDGTLAFLTVAASKEGQEAFNPVKGSICARTDCDESLFGPYLQTALADWSQDTVVGSLTHGVVANNGWKAKIETALGLFLADGDVAAFQQALAAACTSDGACGQ